MVSIVQQEPSLFEGTVRENIFYGMTEEIENYSVEKQQEMLDTAAKKANCFDFIHDKNIMPEGYETEVGVRGGNLSGGQK